MKTLFWTIIVLTLTTSCVTQKRCARRFPASPETIIKDSIVYKERITYRDTTIFVKLPADTIFKKDTITIVNGYVHVLPVYAESKMASAKAWIRLNKLNLMLADKDTTLEIKLTDALKTAQFWEMRFKTEKQKEIVRVKYVPVFWKFTGWIGIITFLGIILFLIIKFRKLLL